MPANKLSPSFLSLFCLLGSLVVEVAATCGNTPVNILKNPSFENRNGMSPASWTGNKYVTFPNVGTANAYDGSYVANMTLPKGQGTARISQRVPISSMKPNGRYWFHVWYKITKITSNPEFPHVGVSCDLLPNLGGAYMRGTDLGLSSKGVFEQAFSSTVPYRNVSEFTLTFDCGSNSDAGDVTILLDSLTIEIPDRTCEFKLRIPPGSPNFAGSYVGLSDVGYYTEITNKANATTFNIDRFGNLFATEELLYIEDNYFRPRYGGLQLSEPTRDQYNKLATCKTTNANNTGALSCVQGPRDKLGVQTPQDGSTTNYFAIFVDSQLKQAGNVPATYNAIRV